MIQLHEPEWNSEDASLLREFLRTPTGVRMLQTLSYRRPAFMQATAHPHKSFASSREVHGYEQAVKTLLGLTEDQDQPLATPKPSNAYPDLDDESAWANINIPA